MMLNIVRDYACWMILLDTILSADYSIYCELFVPVARLFIFQSIMSCCFTVSIFFANYSKVYKRVSILPIHVSTVTV
jgi:hypothetical protein